MLYVALGHMTFDIVGGWIRVRTAIIGLSSYATEKRMTVRCLLQLMIGSASCSSCIALVCVVLVLTRRLTYRF